MLSMTKADALGQGLCAAGLVHCVNGNDLFALIGALAGTLYAMTNQAQVGWQRRSLNISCIVILSLSATWFVAENLPVLAAHLGLQQIELFRSRMLIAWLIAYFAQDILLPTLATLGNRWMAKPGDSSS